MSNGSPLLGVLVSGGAPTLHVAAGALCLFHERGVKFDVVAASGAGALPALLYLVPKKSDPQTALKCVLDMNIHDAIYDLIPSNYKVFFKYGPFAPLFWQLGQMIPHFPLDPKEQATNAAKRLYNDMVDLVTAAVTPTTLTYWSKSVLRRVQVVNDLINWQALPGLDNHFFLNTFNLDQQKLELFNKTTMTPDAFYAALAMPWLYPPTAAAIGGALHTEGASHDPSGIEAAVVDPSSAPHKVLELDAIVVLDTIGADLWVDPESLYEALELTIMDPIVTLSENVAALYAAQEWVYQSNPKSFRLSFDIPPWKSGQILEWSYSNAVTLWDTGYRAARKFCDDGNVPATGGGQLDPAALEKSGHRYLDTIKQKGESRQRDFLKLFGDINNPSPPPPLVVP